MFGDFGDPKFLMVVMIVAAVVIVIFAPSRRVGELRRTCRNCGAAHPTFARFCRRCGKRL